MNIVEFLRARYADEEAKAREAIADRINVYGQKSGYVDKPDYDFIAWTGDHPSGVVMVGPEWVLREAEAKRRVLDLIDGLVIQPHEHEGIARALASVYADHEDYDPEWAT